MQNYNHQLALIAVVAALALFGVVAITIASIPSVQEAEAQTGCKTSVAFNASKGRCFRG